MGLLSKSKEGITKKTGKKLRLGMGKTEVIAILGEPYNSKMMMSAIECCRYRTEDSESSGGLVLSFVNDFLSQVDFYKTQDSKAEHILR